jgi:hypothetical protein
MKKALIIEDNSVHFEIIKKLCDTLGIQVYPNNEEEFSLLRSSVCTIFAPGNQQKYVDASTIDIEETLSTFFADDQDDQIICICDYQLMENRPEVNGIRFYYKFLKNKDVIMISGTWSNRDARTISQFCAEGQNRIFIQKDDDYEQKRFIPLLWGELEAFTKK